MGFIKAFSGAIGSTLGDQWLDYFAPKNGVSSTSIIFSAVQVNSNNGRGTNDSGSSNIISNGSKIVVPEGFGLVTMQDGAITNFICEAGGFEFRSDDINSQSLFAGDGILGPLIKQSFERFKFGGMPSSQQTAFYINLKEIPNNKFGTANKIFFDDKYLNAQIGLMARGTYTFKVIDPILFIKNFVPANYLITGAADFDMADVSNAAGSQLFNEVVSTLGSAFSLYANDESKENRITKIQSDQVGFAKSLSQAVEDAYQWKSDRGLEIVKTAIVAIEYDEITQQLLADVNRADALMGARGNSNLQQSVAKGIESAGATGGGSNMAFMGMGMNAAGSMMGGLQQPVNNMQSNIPDVPVGDPTEKLLSMKKLLDAGAISQEEYDKVKAQILGF